MLYRYVLKKDEGRCDDAPYLQKAVLQRDGKLSFAQANRKDKQ